MTQLNKQTILIGRDAVDAYRTAHTQLYAAGWHKGIPEEHTPLLEKMLGDLKKVGFNSLDEFFAASEELNVQELGFKDKKDFEAGIAKLNVDAEKQILIDGEGNPIEVVIDTPEAKVLRKALEGKWR